MAVGRDRVRRHSSVGTHEHTIDDWKRFSSDLQLLGIERDRQQFAAARVDQVAGWGVLRARPSFDEDLLFSGVERHHSDIRVVVRVRIRQSNREQDGLPGRQEGRMPVKPLAALLVDLQKQFRRTA